MQSTIQKENDLYTNKQETREKGVEENTKGIKQKFHSTVRSIILVGLPVPQNDTVHLKSTNDINRTKT